MKKGILLITASLLFSSLLLAQPSGDFKKQRPKMKAPEEIAREQADKMQAEVGLDAKQYKKVYNLVKKDQEYRQSQREERFGGMPPQGGPGMGGGMPGGGMPPQGGMSGGPGMGGGRPDFSSMPKGQRPEGMPGMGPGGSEVSQEYLDKQEKKLQKILTPAQYAKWRSAHPAEQQQLPPMEMFPEAK